MHALHECSQALQRETRYLSRVRLMQGLSGEVLKRYVWVVVATHAVANKELTLLDEARYGSDPRKE